jgi:hypothetical protein
MTTATLEPLTDASAIDELRQACLKRIEAHPGDPEAHDAILDLYLETLRRLDHGWTVKSVITNALIRLSRL